MADLASMTDLELKAEMTRLWHLRVAGVTREAELVLIEQMRACRDELGRRTNERTVEYERIAETTPGAVSTKVFGVTAGAGAGAVAPGGN